MINKMVRVEVIHRVKLRDYDKIYNIKRIDNKQEYNRFLVGDTFDCSIDYCKYLMGETDENQPLKLVKVIEVKEMNGEEMA